MGTYVCINKDDCVVGINVSRGCEASFVCVSDAYLSFRCHWHKPAHHTGVPTGLCRVHLPVGEYAAYSDSQMHSRYTMQGDFA